MTTPTTQTIDLRAESGGVEYTWAVTITESSSPPKDISTDILVVSLGTKTDPGTWQSPDIDEAGANAAGVAASVQNQRMFKLLIGTTLRPAAGSYYLWSRISDSPEVAPRKHQKITILADA